MTLLWIFLGAVAAITGVGVLAARLTDDRGQRASGEHTFRAAHPTPVTLPYMAAGSYSSVQERHHGRPGELHKDVLAACIGRPHLLDDIRAERTKNLPPPTPNQAAGYWQANGKDIAATLSPRVVAALANAKPDQTVIDLPLIVQAQLGARTVTSYMATWRDWTPQMMADADQIRLAVGGAR